MRVAVCSNENPLTYYRAALQAELERRGHEVLVINGVEDARAVVHLIDAAIIRLRRFQMEPRTLPRALRAAQYLAFRGVRFLNDPDVTLRAKDKLLCHALYNDAGLPQPETLHLLDLAGSSELPWAKAVVKPVAGERGNGVQLVSSLEEAFAHADAIKSECLIQPYIDAVGVRVVATRDRAVFAVEKVKAESGWMATFAAGAARREVEVIPAAYEELAVAMTQAVDGDILGHDLLATATGEVYALESNTDFGLVDVKDEELTTPVMVDLLEQIGQ